MTFPTDKKVFIASGAIIFFALLVGTVSLVAARESQRQNDDSFSVEVKQRSPLLSLKHQDRTNENQPTLFHEKTRASGKISPTPEPGQKPVPGDDPTILTGTPKCDDSAHNERAWHGLYNSELDCHYDHEHKMNPHDFDDVFGTDFYTWAGGEVSYPWQTFAGASSNFESYIPDSCTENNCKHEGNKWLGYKNRTSEEQINGALLLGTHAITDARVHYHQIGGELGALTRFHSVWLEAKACYFGEVSAETCGTYQGGGWLDFGRLNYPKRGDYLPLPGDPVEFANTPAELAPYRIHSIGKNSLDSWQSEGNVYNYLPSDPEGKRRIRVGHGIHFLQGESPGETNAEHFGLLHGMNVYELSQFWCLDPVTHVLTCNNNNSAAALFRTWVSIPRDFDGSDLDEDGIQDGYVTFHLRTNRYGDVVECSEIGLDCVPAIAEHFPVGGCKNPEGFCRAAYRGSADQDAYDADTSPEGEWWIEYPN